MANIINLPPDPNAEALGKGAQGAGAGLASFLVKLKRDADNKDYIVRLIQTKQAEDERALATGEQADPNAGMLVESPRHMDIATKVGLVNQVFKPPQKADQLEEMVAYFEVPKAGVKGAAPRLVKEQRKGLPRPAGAMTREEIASFLQFPSEGAKPTEKELDIGAEYRKIGRSLQASVGRMRLIEFEPIKQERMTSKRP